MSFPDASYTAEKPEPINITPAFRMTDPRMGVEIAIKQIDPSNRQGITPSGRYVDMPNNEIRRAISAGVPKVG